MSDGMRAKNAPRVGDWDLRWVQDRVKGGHHQVLAKYLRFRTPEQAAEADAAGLTVEHILRTAFLMKNGHTAVPEAAVRVYQHVPGAPASPVIAVCRASRDSRAVMALAKAIARRHPRREDMDQESRDLLDELLVRDVMGR